MAVSKRTRFEVLRRDNYTCRYCRATDQPLTVDHVVPTALGGSDAPDNLVAACRDCNAGKASSSPDGTLVANVSEDAVRWAKARAQAASDLAASFAERKARVLPFIETWTHWEKSAASLPVDWSDSVNRWLDYGLTIELITEAVNIAWRNENVPAHRLFAYVCGVVRNQLAELDERTAVLLAEEAKPVGA